MNIEARTEVLSTALTAALLARSAVEAGDMSTEAVRREIRTTNVLFDACLDLGMSHEVADHESWAAERVTRWLVAS